MRVGSVAWHKWQREHAGADDVAFDEPRELYLEKRSSRSAIGNTLWDDLQQQHVPGIIETHMPNLDFTVPISGRFRITNYIYAFTPSSNATIARFRMYLNGNIAYEVQMAINNSAPGAITGLWASDTILVNENDEITCTIMADDSLELSFTPGAVTSTQVIEEIPAVNIYQLKDAYVGLTFPRNPLPNDDLSNIAVYPGSLFRNTMTGRLWICTNTALNQAEWSEILHGETAWRRDPHTSNEPLGPRNTYPCYLRIGQDIAFEPHHDQDHPFREGMRWFLKNIHTAPVTVTSDEFPFEVIGSPNVTTTILQPGDTLEITLLGNATMDRIIYPQ